MALNVTESKDRLKDRIKDLLGIPYSDARLDLICQAFANWLHEELTTQADIEIQTNDLEVLPGTFKDSLSAPITGSTYVTPTTLSTRIK